VWEFVEAGRRSNLQSRHEMIPDLWAVRQVEIEARGMEMER
jgi:hypothetical protein